MLSQKARYLISFQYSGTMYSGVMETPPHQATLGVQNYLEKAAEKLRPLVPVKFVISSRTDTGVHALCNTAHIDIERSGGKPPFSESVLVQALNRNLKHEPIRVLAARRVSDTFHARFSALSRTYVYRVVTGCSCPSDLPVFERNLCWVTQRGHLDLTAMQEAAGLLVGTHDFSTFRSASSELPAKNPVKTIDQLEIRPSSGFLMHHVKSSDLKFWELEFTSRSFLYKQVRRMAGVLVAVGQHRLDPECVKTLLDIRDLMAYPPSTIAPACGLFLKNVEYCEADLDTGRTEAET
uniref:tRNA pseudouridine synthase n=1 Tax=Anolis carolinensis TaxID=28377 RepID=H9GKP4_ANOCA|nr:PREDICTED: tRNA pseudouridine synthase-like 1 isoform X1 [Anolis carolinensis]|eukprot:XP_003228980.1 PREDICTED: tRNA pseudouridine synthase-like 1 isoform X1 [Anolis carolinensis]